MARTEHKEQVTAPTHTEAFTHARTNPPLPTAHTHTHQHLYIFEYKHTEIGKVKSDSSFYALMSLWGSLSEEPICLSSELRKPLKGSE